MKEDVAGAAAASPTHWRRWLLTVQSRCSYQRARRIGRQAPSSSSDPSSSSASPRSSRELRDSVRSLVGLLSLRSPRERRWGASSPRAGVAASPRDGPPPEQRWLADLSAPDRLALLGARVELFLAAPRDCELRRALLAFLEHEHAAENAKFWRASFDYVRRFDGMSEQARLDYARAVVRLFLAPDAPQWVCCSTQVLARLTARLARAEAKAEAVGRDLFDAARSEIIAGLQADSFPRFVDTLFPANARRAQTLAALESGEGKGWSAENVRSMMLSFARARTRAPLSRTESRSSKAESLSDGSSIFSTRALTALALV